MSTLARITHPRALDDAPPALRERLALTAQIALVFVAIAALGTAANLYLGDHAMVAGSAALLVPAVTVPALLAGGRFALARALLVAGGPVLMLGPGLASGGVHVANLAALPYAVLTMSLLPNLVFDPDTERAPRAAFNVLLLAVLLGHDLVLARLAGQPLPPLNAKLAQAVLWLLIAASMRFCEHRRAH